MEPLPCRLQAEELKVGYLHMLHGVVAVLVHAGAIMCVRAM